MPAVDSSFVIIPRFTTLVGATTFTTLPMDVSSYGGAQFQVWRGPFRTKSATPPPPPPTFIVFLEESLDTEEWVLGPETSQSFVIAEIDRKFFAYDFRLRWFRLRIVITGNEPIVTCWAEGLLRGGGGGLWPQLDINAGPAGAVAGRSIDVGGSSGMDPNMWSLMSEQDQLSAAAKFRWTGKPGSKPGDPNALTVWRPK